MRDLVVVEILPDRRIARGTETVEDESDLLLLDRSDFVDVTPLPAGAGGDQRFGVTALVPTT